MSVYFTSTNPPTPWLILPSKKETLLRSPERFVEKTFEDFWRDTNPNSRLAYEQTHRKMQLDASDAVANELGLPLNMADLHKMTALGSHRINMSAMCIISLGKKRYINSITEQNIEGFEYSYGIHTNKAHKTLHPELFNSIPFIGIDSNVLHWMFEHGGGIECNGSQRSNAMDMLWKFKTIAMLGDHDWFHSLALNLATSGGPERATWIKKILAAAAMDPPFKEDFGKDVPSVWNMEAAAHNGLKIPHINLDEGASLLLHYENFKKLFHDKPKVKEGILRQGVLLLEKLETIRNHALTDAEKITDTTKRSEQIEQTNHCCNYWCEVMLAHLLRMPITKQDLEMQIVAHPKPPKKRNEVEPPPQTISVRDAYERLHLSPSTPVKKIEDARNRLTPKMNLEGEIFSNFGRWYYGTLLCHDTGDLALIHEYTTRNHPIELATRLQHSLRESPYADSPAMKRAEHVYDTSREGKKANSVLAGEGRHPQRSQDRRRAFLERQEAERAAKGSDTEPSR